MLLEVRGKARHAIDACKTLTSRDVGGIIVISRYVRDIVRKALSTKMMFRFTSCTTPSTPVCFEPLGPSDEKVGLYGHDTAKRPVVLWVGRMSEEQKLQGDASYRRPVGTQHAASAGVLGCQRHERQRQHEKVLAHGTHGRVRTSRPTAAVCSPHDNGPRIQQGGLRSGGCVLSSSKSEGFQNSLLEAMACGVPVVSSAVGGNVELVDDGVNGRLYPLGQPIVATRSIRQILNNTRSGGNMPAAGLDRVRLRHTPSLHARTLMHVLESTPVMTYGTGAKTVSHMGETAAAAAAKSAVAQAKTAATPGKRTVKKTAKKLVAKSGSKPLTKASTPKKKFKSATTTKSARVCAGRSGSESTKADQMDGDIAPGVRR